MGDTCVVQELVNCSKHSVNVFIVCLHEFGGVILTATEKPQVIIQHHIRFIAGSGATVFAFVCNTRTIDPMYFAPCVA
jgi:hypothetical protein